MLPAYGDRRRARDYDPERDHDARPYEPSSRISDSRNHTLIHMGYAPAYVHYRDLPGPRPRPRHVIFHPLPPQYRESRFENDEYIGDPKNGDGGSPGDRGGHGESGGGGGGRGGGTGRNGGGGGGGHWSGGGGGGGHWSGGGGGGHWKVSEPARPRAPVEVAPRIRFVHVQGDDIVVELTGCESYVLEVKTCVRCCSYVPRLVPY